MALARPGAGRGHSECGSVGVTARLMGRVGPNVDERHFAVGQGLALVVFIDTPPAAAFPGLVVMDPGRFGNAGCGGLGRT